MVVLVHVYNIAFKSLLKRLPRWVCQIWTGQGISHVASNQLPKMVEEGKAKRIEWISEHMPSLMGVVEFR